MKKNYDVIIIGAGPAGISASIYLKRANVDFLMIEKSTPGGKLNETFRIENYPGYTDKKGSGLAYMMYEQIDEFNINLVKDTVLTINKEEDKYVVKTQKIEYTCNYVILCTGRISKKFECENSKEYEDKGISYCATCDGALYKDKDIVIVGGGNTALESAIYLSDIVKSVTILNRSNKLRASEKEQDDVSKLSNIKILYNSEIKRINGNNEIESIILNDDSIINTSAIFVCIGTSTDVGYYQKLNLEYDKLGIIVDKDMKTSLDNVYACGDIISKSLYQVVTATSEGAIAATSIIKKLKK